MARPECRRGHATRRASHSLHIATGRCSGPSGLNASGARCPAPFSCASAERAQWSGRLLGSHDAAVGEAKVLIAGRFGYPGGMFRLLRIAAASFCFLAAAAFAAMLVRSYWWSDAVVYEPRHELSFTVHSFEGNVTLRRVYNPAGCTNKMWRTVSHDLTSMQGLDAYRKQSVPAWYWGGESNKFYANHWVVAPHWLGAFIGASAGVAILRGRSNRFSLRGAFIGTTLLALLLGLAVSLG